MMKISIARFAMGACAVAMLAPAPAKAQLWTWTKDQMVEYTKAWTGERFADGRPKVSDSVLQRARGLSQEEITINWGAATAPPGAPAAAGGRGGGGGGGGFAGGRGTPYSQFEGGWQVLHPGKKMVGRAVTCVFMPARADLDAVVTTKAKEKGINSITNQYCIDQLQPGDVLVVDLLDKKEGGTLVGDNLFYYIQTATKSGGLVVDGAIRDLEGIGEMDMPAYFRHTHPTAIGGVTLAGVNVPIRIGNVTVLPGDVVVGDREGVAFIPPQLANGVLDRADETHVHDEWTRKKFDEGKYKSTEIYGSPKDPALQKEYQEYLKKRLEEIRSGKK
ncbi:MAG TPA: dimethylmenaquinone methyltransferase [Bryobacteraceae bacterium]|jgi:regulator of RNase E activity RraA